MREAAIVSFRLGGVDGVSVESAKWQRALQRLGFSVRTVAGEGPVDHVVSGLAIAATHPPSVADVAAALLGAELVVVENLCSLPLNPPAADVVSAVCRGRPTILHHHDLAWQRAQFAHFGPPPDDPAWRHVTINELSRLELAARGIAAVTIYNTFDLDPAPGDRAATRRALDIKAEEHLVLQPTRALARKNVGGGLNVASAVGGTYWLLGPAEDGYGPELDALLSATDVRVVRGTAASGRGSWINDAYAASDVVALPSWWEGFGNPSVESAVFGRPLVIGPYPVAAELAAFGFRWFGLNESSALGRWLREPDPSLIEHNYAVARRYFSSDDLPGRLAPIVEGML